MEPPLIPLTSTPEIRSREDFFRILASATAEVDTLVTREPAYPVWGALQRQLHAIRDWTKDGVEPTEAQRQKVSIGLIAARELEPAGDAAMQDLITRLHLLNYYWRQWPSAGAAPLSAVLSAAAPPILTAGSSVPAAGVAKRRMRIEYPPRSMAILLISSLALFVAACALPALEFRNSHKPNDMMVGLEVLAIGWTGIFVGVFPWYANPFWLLGLVSGFFRRRTLTALLGIFAVLFAALTFFLIGRELPGDEGGVTKTTVIRLLTGCYLWMASMMVLPLAAFLRNRS